MIQQNMPCILSLEYTQKTLEAKLGRHEVLSLNFVLKLVKYSTNIIFEMCKCMRMITFHYITIEKKHLQLYVSL
jgi:hypothetical protein